jgi:hypothetical protein
VEWLYWCDQKGVKPPVDAEMIRDNSILLKPDESVILMFRYLSWRHLDTKLIQEQNPGAIVKQYDQFYRSKNVSLRSINIYIS